MAEFTYKRWSGARRTITAHKVRFEPTHVVFYDYNGRVVLAERPEYVSELREEGADGSVD